jgi:hypothetical protein
MHVGITEELFATERCWSALRAAGFVHGKRGRRSPLPTLRRERPGALHTADKRQLVTT